MTISPAEDSAETGSSTTTTGTQLFRAMAREDDGNPRIAANHLGIRVGTDIQPDDDRNVRPGTGGMSVTPNDPMDLHQHVRPVELGGTGKRPVWWINDEKLPVNLNYRPDPRSRTHGFVEPSDLMSIEDYQEAIEGTAPNWSLYA